MWDINYMSSAAPECRAQDPSSNCNWNPVQLYPCLQTLVISQEFLCSYPCLCRGEKSILAHIYVSVQAVDIFCTLEYVLKSQKSFLFPSISFSFCFPISMERNVTVTVTIGFKIWTLWMFSKGEMGPRLKSVFYLLKSIRKSRGVSGK